MPTLFLNITFSIKKESLSRIKTKTAFREIGGFFVIFLELFPALHFNLLLFKEKKQKDFRFNRG
jgi:hypothetical protein